MHRFAVVVFAFCLLAGSAKADVFLKHRKTTPAYQIMGQGVPAKEVTATTWIGTEKARFDDGENMSTILDTKSKKMTILNHGEKTYMIMPLDEKTSLLDSAIDRQAKDAGEAAKTKEFMGGMMGAMNIQVTVTPTAEEKKIDKWDCTRYEMKMTMAMGSSQSELWATEQIKIDAGQFNRLRNAPMANQPGFEQLAKEFAKIKGVPVLTITTARVMNTDVKTTEQLVEYGERAAPAGTYDVPKGYKEQESFGGAGFGEGEPEFPEEDE
jgi:hypothetical protein